MPQKHSVIVITGCSKGFGKALSENLANESCKVYIGQRTNSLCRSSKDIKFLHLDLCEEASIETFVDCILKQELQIDALIHNAGLAYYCPVDAFTLKESKELFDVNFFGAFRLTQLFLKQFRAQCAGKIIFISTVRVADPCPFMGMYIASKTALEAIAEDWHTSLSKWNVDVSIIELPALDTGIDIKHGSYFENSANPYLPYKSTSVKYGSIDFVIETVRNTVYASSKTPLKIACSTSRQL